MEAMLSEIYSVGVWPIALVGVWIVMDICTGLAKAFATHTYDSTKMRQGLWHKTAILSAMVLAYAIQGASGLIDFGFSVPIVVPATVYILIMETGSIVENIAEVNPDLKGTALLRLFKSGKIGDHDSGKDEGDTDAQR